MDKYTIDLDKLLNDFEYSELTEQNNIISSNCQNSQPYQNQKNHGAQKHSINNVFHSLNEYLNTDIRETVTATPPGSSTLPEEEDEVVVKPKITIIKEDVVSIEQIFNNIATKDEFESEENTVNNNNIIEIEEETNDLIEEPEAEVVIEEPEVVIEEPEEQKVVIEDPPNPKVVKFDDPIEISDTEIENELDQLEVEAEPTQPIEPEPQPETETILRPNSLELDETQPQQSINLIGEPGSTPYNNVYVSVPEPPEPPEPSEPEPEPEEKTLSPTLSESSSTYDSPNTSDSCNDTSLEEPNNNPRTTSSLLPTTPSIGLGLALGKAAPFWTPDSDALSCLHCSKKFTVLNRRHHCRACGLVLCSKCSNMKSKLEYMDNQEARVCLKCYDILLNETPVTIESPNPNNPMEYCSTVPPLMQATAQGGAQPPPSVMVPVGVLKHRNNQNNKTRSNKSVMFMDGIRPGCDLTELDTDFNYKQKHKNTANSSVVPTQTSSRQKNQPKIYPETMSYIPVNGLPPIVNVQKSDVFYSECSNDPGTIEQLRNNVVTFAIQRNLHIQLKIINMDCCINKIVWCFTTVGMISVGQDEIVILLELIENEPSIPADVFLHLNNIYLEAVKGTSIIELGLSIHPTSNFLESKNHAGFLYIKPTFQCIQNLIIPKEEPFLMGILIHRWETPWAKIFPLRLLLRLGAEYRYYPSPIISTRHRESVYVEIGHTIINLLADFRNFSYTIPSVRGLTIHMEDRQTTVCIPMNRYEQVMKALNNSTEHILAFSATFSPQADSHLVCIQDTQHGNNTYTTHAINIHNKPRKVTGASFIILNGALKSSSGLTAKSSIIEDGLMIHILPEQMLKLRQALKQMKTFKITCGCVNAAESQDSDETINIAWIENDVSFNVGVISPIDNMSLSGVPSIRVHNGRDFICNSGNKMIRWTEVFIIQSGEELIKSQDPIDISKISENISKGTSQALVKYLDLLATNSCTKIGIRTNLNIENVSYLAGSNGLKLPPIYMKSLDNELIPVLHKITSNFAEQLTVILELKFHILNV